MIAKIRTIIAIIRGYILSKKIINNDSFERGIVDCLVEHPFKMTGLKYVKYDFYYSIIREYTSHLLSINELLYKKLSDEDKKTLVRWFLKRYYGIETATEEEKKQIEDAFTAVQSLYQQNRKEQIEIKYLGKTIKYLKNSNYGPDTSKQNILMNYYDIAHAFFLTEYEKDGFNPENGETIFDCGAAYGDTLLLFRALYPDSYVISFEASDDAIERAKMNAAINGLNNYTIEKAYLYSDSKSHWMNKETGAIDDQALEESIEINTQSIDDYLNNMNNIKIGLIKFDIEGAEQKALEGARETIKKFKPFLYIPIYHLQSDIYRIPEILNSFGLQMELSLKWTEKLVWGFDCVLFVRFV